MNNEKMKMYDNVVGFTNKLQQTLSLTKNTKNDMLRVDKDGKYTTRPICKLAAIVETQEELNLHLNVSEDFSEIFNYWQRISRAGETYSNEAIPDELQGWQYIPETDSIQSTINSVGLIGFISPESFDSYIFDVQVSAVDTDDDNIGLCLAFATDPDTGESHTLTVHRAMNGAAPMLLFIDLGLSGGKALRMRSILNGLTWADGTVADSTNGQPLIHGSWTDAGIGCRLRVIREGDQFTVKTSQVNSTEFFEPATFSFNLNDDKRYEVFKGYQQYGYIAQSQRYATWTVNERPVVSYPIIDIRTWDVYRRIDGVWVKTPSTKADIIQMGLLVPNWSHQNPLTSKFFFMDNATNLYRC